MFNREEKFIAPAVKRGIPSVQSIDSLNKQLEVLERKSLQMPELSDLKQNLLKLRREMDDLLTANGSEKQGYEKQIVALSSQLAKVTERLDLQDAQREIKTYLNNNQPEEGAVIALRYPKNKIESLIDALKPEIKNPKLSSVLIVWLTHILPEDNDLFWLGYATCVKLMEAFNKCVEKNDELSPIGEVLRFMQAP